jgi:hypothetical protein
MTPAANERVLAGKWVVWWKHERKPVVDMAGKVQDWRYVKTWYHDQVREKRGNMLITVLNDWVDVLNAWIVSEIYTWPRWESGWRKPLTDTQFNELMTRCQP